MVGYEQSDLFGGLYGGLAPHQKHSDTSKAAALELLGNRRASLRALVGRYVAGCGQSGATDEEIQVELEMNGNTERPRRCELVEAGVLVDSGERRRTRNGRKAVVWIVAE